MNLAEIIDGYEYHKAIAVELVIDANRKHGHSKQTGLAVELLSKISEGLPHFGSMMDYIGDPALAESISTARAPLGLELRRRLDNYDELAKDPAFVRCVNAVWMCGEASTLVATKADFILNRYMSEKTG